MIRVLIADDQDLVRGALAALLSTESDIEVVAQVGDGDAVLPAVLDSDVDVALLDIEMPGKNGIEAAADIAAAVGAGKTTCRAMVVGLPAPCPGRRRPRFRREGHPARAARRSGTTGA